MEEHMSAAAETKRRESSTRDTQGSCRFELASRYLAVQADVVHAALSQPGVGGVVLWVRSALAKQPLSSA